MTQNSILHFLSLVVVAICVIGILVLLSPDRNLQKFPPVKLCSGPTSLDKIEELIAKLEETRLLKLSEFGRSNTTTTHHKKFSNTSNRHETKNYIVLNARTNKNFWTKITNIDKIKTVSVDGRTYCKVGNATGQFYGEVLQSQLYNWGVTAEQCSVKHHFTPPECRQHTGPAKSLESLDNVETLKPHNTVKTPTSYVHVITKGIIDSNGYVLADSYFIIPNGCIKSEQVTERMPDAIYREVFVISQFWGEGYFHAYIEDIPRLAMYIPFLTKFDQIKIHVAGKARYIVDNLNALGIKKDRLVIGLVQGDVVYLPQGGGCGDIHQPSGHLLSLYYHRYIENHILKYAKATSVEPEIGVHRHQHESAVNLSIKSRESANCSVSMNLNKQQNLDSKEGSMQTKCNESTRMSTNTDNQSINIKGQSGERRTQLKNKNIILIKRSKKRWLVQHTKIARVLQDIAHKSGFNFMEYNDVKLPSYNDTLVMFYNAVLIVAPHGAGLSNMVYSKPGTYIVEVLCRGDPNFCYKDLAQKQGMHYFGVSSVNECGAMTVNIQRLTNIVKLFVAEILNT